MGARLRALAADEVAVGGGNAARQRLDVVAVRGDAHRAAGLAPLEAGIEKDLVQSFLFRVLLNAPRAGHYPGFHVRRRLAALGNRSGRAQVGQARVGAGADEHAVDFRAGDRIACFQSHVGERLGLLVRDPAVDADDVLGAGAPGDLRRERGAVDRMLGVEFRAGVGGQCFPVRDRGVPLRALGRVAPPLQEGVSLFVRRHHADLGAQFDGQVAHRHAAFHVQAADRLARVFHGVTHAARGAEFADQRQDQVLAGDAARRRAAEIDAHGLRPLLHHGLRRHHVHEFSGADAPRKRAERAVRASVAVAADQQRARQREAQFGSDHVHDALAVLADVVEVDAGLFPFGAEVVDHLVGPGRASSLRAGHRRDHVVEGADCQPRIAQPQAALRQLHLAALARQFVHYVARDKHQVHAVAKILDHVLLPDLLEHGFHLTSTCRFSKSQTSWKPTSSCNCFMS